MSELARYHPTERFTSLADAYAKYRPDYPDAALDFILSRCGLSSHSLLIDVGCGTGISTRLFARRGLPVLGIEPNAPMRARAEAEPLPAGVPAPRYQAGRAEATGLPSGQADAVLAAQAFHWFQADEALREFHRILRPGGWVILLSNERDEADPFTAAYGAVFRTVAETAAIEGPRSRAGEPLLASLLFTAAECVLFRHQQAVDVDGLLGRAFSASYAPREPARAEAFATALRAVFDQFQQAGRVVVQYQTAVYVARRRDPDG